MEEIIQTLVNDSDSLLALCESGYEEAAEYQLFARCLSDQTVVENGKRRLRTKEDGTINSKALQNPSDPDATYRNKAGKQHRGYTANMEETVGRNGSVVTDYQYEQNTYTDSRFLQDTLSQMEKSDEEIILVTDGGYDGQDNVELAKEKNVTLVTTALVGKEAPDILAEFVFNEDGTRLIRKLPGMNPEVSHIQKAQGSATFPLTGITVSAAHIRISAAPKSIKKSPGSLHQRTHPAAQKANGICRAQSSAIMQGSGTGVKPYHPI